MRRMRLVEHAEHVPGCCCLTNTATGPFIDTERQDEYGNRLYVSVQFATEMGRALGLVMGTELEQAVAGEAAAKLRADEAEDTLDRLRAAVRTTLVEGAVIKERELGGGEVTRFELRPRRGDRKVEV